MYIGTIYVLKRQEGLGWAVTTRTGPNDAGCVVWALSKFFSFLHVFLILNNVYRYYLRVKAMGRARMGGNDQNDADTDNKFGWHRRCQRIQVIWVLCMFFSTIFFLSN